MSDDELHTTNHYFSTFITGFDDFINKALHTYLADVKIEMLLDGLVVYETKDSKDKIRQLPFFNNTFLPLEKKVEITSEDIEKNFMGDASECKRYSTRRRNTQTPKNIQGYRFT